MVANKLGIKTNKIAKISNFLSDEDVERLYSYLSASQHPWGETSFDNSYGISLVDSDPLLVDSGLSENFISTLHKKLKEAVETTFEHQVLNSRCHAQRWEVGSFAYPHSDNSDHDGDRKSVV